MWSWRAVSVSVSVSVPRRGAGVVPRGGPPPLNPLVCLTACLFDCLLPSWPRLCRCLTRKLGSYIHHVALLTLLLWNEFSPGLRLWFKRGKEFISRSTASKRMTRAWQHHGKTMGRKRMATTWQEHGTSMATTWQEHGKSMAMTWQQHGNEMATTWQQHGNSMAIA